MACLRVFRNPQPCRPPGICDVYGMRVPCTTGDYRLNVSHVVSSCLTLPGASFVRGLLRGLAAYRPTCSGLAVTSGCLSVASLSGSAATSVSPIGDHGDVDGRVVGFIDEDQLTALSVGVAEPGLRQPQSDPADLVEGEPVVVLLTVQGVHVHAGNAASGRAPSRGGWCA
jgi:hypothetical protein